MATRRRMCTIHSETTKTISAWVTLRSNRVSKLVTPSNLFPSPNHRFQTCKTQKWQRTLFGNTIARKEWRVSQTSAPVVPETNRISLWLGPLRRLKSGTMRKNPTIKPLNYATNRLWNRVLLEEASSRQLKASMGRHSNLRWVRQRRAPRRWSAKIRPPPTTILKLSLMLSNAHLGKNVKERSEVQPKPIKPNTSRNTKIRTTTKETLWYSGWDRRKTRTSISKILILIHSEPLPTRKDRTAIKT